MRTIPELLAARAVSDPDAVALLAPARASLTYASLWRDVRGIAGSLAALGVTRGDRVAIVLRNGPEMAVSFLSVCAVASSAPLNPTYSADEFAFYLGDLETRLLLTANGAAPAAIEAAQRAGVAVAYIEPDASRGAGAFSISGVSPGATDIALAQPDDIALLLHTSGTTARPKLVPLTQANLLASARNIAATLALTPADRCLNVMPLFHIHGLVAALVSSLNAGASVACSPGFDADRFHAWLEEFSPTWYTAVPTMHQAVIAATAAGKKIPEGHSIRFVRSSSAALAPKVLHELEAVFGAPVVEAYGMTEASHQMASNPLPPKERKPGSVGPAAGPRVAIMNDDGELVANGTVGEVVIQGDNVTRGYLANPDANAKAFTNGWFRTGDQGYMDADGYVFLTGRIKEIINRGGEKISPREIDEALLEHPAIAQAAAFSVPHATLGEDVAAIVVLKPGANATVPEIRAFAFERLADFKVPSSVIIADQIPKGPTGKVQRVSLAKQVGDALTTTHVAPRDQFEGLIAKLWEKALGVPRVGVRDNYFLIGGDSLRATGITARINELFGVSLPATTMFRHPTIEEIIGEVRQRASKDRLAAMERTFAKIAAMSENEAKLRVQS